MQSEDGILMSKHVEVMFLLLYVCDIVHLVFCNKRKYRWYM